MAMLQVFECSNAVLLNTTSHPLYLSSRSSPSVTLTRRRRNRAATVGAQRCADHIVCCASHHAQPLPSRSLPVANIVRVLKSATPCRQRRGSAIALCASNLPPSNLIPASPGFFSTSSSSQSRHGGGKISASGGNGLAVGGGGWVSINVFSRHDDAQIFVHDYRNAWFQCGGEYDPSGFAMDVVKERKGH